MNFNIKSYKFFNCGVMAFLKKRAYTQTFKNDCVRNENEERNTTIFESLFSNAETHNDKNSCKSVFSKSEDYILPGSPVCTTDVVFDTQHIHSMNCPSKTKKTTNIELYTRHNVNSVLSLKDLKSYLVWYNIVLSTGYRNNKAVCCAIISVEVSTITGSSSFKTYQSEQTTCCETLHSNKIETVDSIRDCIYLDSITNKKTDTFDSSFLSSIFTNFYNVFLTVFEEIYPSCIMFGLNNIIIKNTQVDTSKISRAFLEKIKDEYSFYYKHVKKTNKTDEVQDIQSWLMSPFVEDPSNYLQCTENIDFLDLLE